MTVFRLRRPSGKDRVDSCEFVYAGERYRGSTGQLDKEAAMKWELRETGAARWAMAPGPPACVGYSGVGARLLPHSRPSCGTALWSESLSSSGLASALDSFAETA